VRDTYASGLGDPVSNNIIRSDFSINNYITGISQRAISTELFLHNSPSWKIPIPEIRFGLKYFNASQLFQLQNKLRIIYQGAADPYLTLQRILT
jgi:hypothetical protein